MPEPKTELTTLDICKMYDVTRTTVYNWRKGKKTKEGNGPGLPFYKLGGNGLSDPTRYAADKVIEFVREQYGREPINQIY